MRREEAQKIHINDALDDGELAAIEQATDAAAPGEWRWRAGSPNIRARVTRYNGDEVDDDASARFMAGARGWIPRLIRWIRRLEEALALARAVSIGAQATVKREREEHEVALERARGGAPGPDDGLRWLVRGARLGIVDERYGAFLVRRWSRGEDISGELLESIVRAERLARETLDAGDDAGAMATGKMDVVALARTLRGRMDEEFRAKYAAARAELATAGAGAPSTRRKKKDPDQKKDP